MTAIWGLIKQEPVAFQAVIQALMALGTSFGLNLSAGQVGAIVTCTAAALAFLTRQAVTPTFASQGVGGRQLAPPAT
jgi:hypothetical protein